MIKFKTQHNHEAGTYTVKNGKCKTPNPMPKNSLNEMAAEVTAILR